MPEDSIDIGMAALTIAKVVYPDLDIKAYSAKIDEMVEKVRILTHGSTDPDYRVRVLNTYLYKMQGFKYDPSEIDVETEKSKNLEDQFLNGILDTKMGNCVTMPMLYIAVAQRLGYPVYAVVAPDHYFVRYIDPHLKRQNIEATAGGYVSDGEYIYTLHVSKKGLESGAYMRTLTYREYVA